MANKELEPHTHASLKGIDWLSTFPFTHLFRTFRLAIHPSKLLLALGAVLICYFGGRFLDLFSPHAVVMNQPIYRMNMPADEIQHYIDGPTTAEFYRWREEARKQDDRMLAELLVQYIDEKPSQAKQLVSEGEALEKLWDALNTRRAKTQKLLQERFEKSEKIIKKRCEEARKSAKDKSIVDEEEKKTLKELNQAAEFLRLSISNSSQVASLVLKLDPAKTVEQVVLPSPEAADQAKDRSEVMADRQDLLSVIALADSYEQAKARQGVGVFQAALSYGILMFNSAVESVLEAKLFFNEDFKGFSAASATPAPGLVKTLGLTAAGLGWFVRVHWLYFAIYSLFCLLVWSIAGGAICRIAALHATRDEKIPLKEAVAFATRKFSYLFSAPLMPVLFVLGCFVAIFAITLPGAIPYVGELFAGPLFILVLAISFVIALIAVGAVGGLGLMYPTIAVEGSDAFDAFSRSYSYVYARPWRTLFYTLVAAIYGTLCFVFVKLFVSLVFTAASAIGGVMMNLDTSSAAPLGKLSAMWFSPSFRGPFFGRFFVFDLGATEDFGSFFIALWVFLIVGLVIAFAISFFFSGYTLIYLLLRQRVDATELDEVYVEEFEPEISFGAPAAGPASTEPTKPAEPTPPAPSAPAGPEKNESDEARQGEDETPPPQTS